MLFRRLSTIFSLLVLALLGTLSVAVLWIVGEPPERRILLLLLAVSAVVGVLVTLAISITLTRQIQQPMQELRQMVERLGTGSTRPQAVSVLHDELSVLGRTFNETTGRLARRIAELEEERQQLRTVLSGMVEGVVALDAEQRILFANERAQELLAFPTPVPVGRPLWEVVRQRTLLDVVTRALDSKEPQREELNWNGGALRSLTIHAACLPGESPRGAVLVLHDTTELRRLERMRREFVANVSHELKTPLSVIKLSAETLLEGAADDPVARGKFLDQIARQSDRLHALILDLLSLARIEAGTELFDLQAVPVSTAVWACLEQLRGRAEARQQRLVVEPPEGGSAGPEEEGVAVWADEEAVDQILANLLDNALKYTPEGGQITVRWRAEKTEAMIEVTDTGMGIPEADLPRIFERFYRVDKARSRELGGTGLGLSIVKHLIQAMHGSVSASSVLEQGTTFTVRLPLARDGG